MIYLIINKDVKKKIKGSLRDVWELRYMCLYYGCVKIRWLIMYLFIMGYIVYFFGF